MIDRRARPRITEDDELIREIVAQHVGVLPAGVHRIELQFGSDSTGDPAVWIVAVVGSEVEATNENVASIGDLFDRLKMKIIKAHTIRWPYTRIEVED